MAHAGAEDDDDGSAAALRRRSDACAVPKGDRAYVSVMDDGAMTHHGFAHYFDGTGAIGQRDAQHIDERRAQLDKEKLKPSGAGRKTDAQLAELQ